MKLSKEMRDVHDNCLNQNFQDRNRNVKWDYLRTGQDAFSPSFESRFIGAGRHVYSCGRGLLAPISVRPPHTPKPERGDMCHLSESQIALSHTKAIYAHPSNKCSKQRSSPKRLWQQ